jgi:hypothetical protein
MSLCLYLDNRGLSFLGIFLSLVGTLGMIYGGLDTIIKVVKDEDGQITIAPPIMVAPSGSGKEYEDIHHGTLCLPHR